MHHSDAITVRVVSPDKKDAAEDKETKLLPVVLSRSEVKIRVLAFTSVEYVRVWVKIW